MSMPKRPSITFYISPELWPKGDIPNAPDIAWSGYGFGPYCWVLQTYLHLRSVGYDCELSSTLPSEGIVLTHRKCCAHNGVRIYPNSKLFLISIAADYGHYPNANIEIVQNPKQTQWAKNYYYVPLWPEPSLKPRPQSSRFQNISFMGFPLEFAPELETDEWSSALNKLGLRWAPRISGLRPDNQGAYPMGDSPWNDYTEVDAVVAVRRFTSYPTFDYKPPSKLINCWLAGVPAILGAESAFRALWRSELDYLEVHSKDEVLAALIHLRENPQLRNAMIENGIRRSKEFCAHATLQRWIRFLEDIAIPSYYHWIGLSSMHQRLSLVDTRISAYTSFILRRLLDRPTPQKRVR